MGQRAKDLADRLITLNNRVIDFVENCSDEGWTAHCDAEDWTVGVVARHLGDGHYNVIEWVKMMLRGEALPKLTMDDIVQSANDHARDHADCTRKEVLDILRRNGQSIAEYVAGLEDQEMDQQGYLAAMDGAVSAEQLMEMVILESGGEHLESMKMAVKQN